MENVLIFDIQHASYVDGPGVRTTVFVKGCPLRCRWCHNPESQSPLRQRMWFAGKCAHCGKCASKCPNGALRWDPADGSLRWDADKCALCGRCEMICPENAVSICGDIADPDAVFQDILKERNVYEATGGGVTFSGGECMLYPDFLYSMLVRCRAAGIHTAVDTAGFVPYESFRKVLPVTDLFLYDIKCITPEKHRAFTGQDNALILDNYVKLLRDGAGVLVRVPLIAQVNADEEEFSRILAFLKAHPPLGAELLPFHAMGENKYRALTGKEPESFAPPSPQTLEEYRARLAAFAQEIGNRQ